MLKIKNSIVMLDGLDGMSGMDEVIFFLIFFLSTFAPILAVAGIGWILTSFLIIKEKLGKVILSIGFILLIPFIYIKVSEGINDREKWNDLGPLFQAIEKNKYDKVKQLINEGYDVNEDKLYIYPSTPLSYAVIKGDMHIVQLLVENGADVNVDPNNGLTPLNGAIAKNNATILSYLLEHGADISFREGPYLESPIEYATATHSAGKEVVEILLKHGADANCNNGAPLKGAILNKNDEVVRCLLEHGANIDNLPELKSLAQSRFNYLYGSDSEQHEDSLKLVRIIELLDEYTQAK